MPETPEVLFTKSAFKIATHCPTQAYYYRNSMSKKKKDGHYEHEGERDMIDLRKIGKSIYGSEIKSCNYTAESPLTLIVKNEAGEVQNPYKALPQLKEIQDELIGEIAAQGLWSNTCKAQLPGARSERGLGKSYYSGESVKGCHQVQRAPQRHAQVLRTRHHVDGANLGIF